MWRIFQWLDRHEPSFYKFTVMAVSLIAVAGTALVLARAHPAAGILFGFGTVFVLMYASMDYRFNRRPKDPSQGDLPISEASEREILRRVRRHANTERLRRHILWLAANEKGKRGDRARGIVAMWKEAENVKNDKPRS